MYSNTCHVFEITRQTVATCASPRSRGVGNIAHKATQNKSYALGRENVARRRPHGLRKITTVPGNNAIRLVEYRAVTTDRKFISAVDCLDQSASCWVGKGGGDRIMNITSRVYMMYDSVAIASLNASFSVYGIASRTCRLITKRYPRQTPATATPPFRNPQSVTFLQQFVFR